MWPRAVTLAAAVVSPLAGTGARVRARRRGRVLSYGTIPCLWCAASPRARLVSPRCGGRARVTIRRAALPRADCARVCPPSADVVFRAGEFLIYGAG
ncbi:MAG TPA: hypothetical protein VK742_01090 [Candidatus Sulfotelmatobacter sp.]|nr:hypothetical protein [Candidatus Sulfotelmatobacter sp.]